MKLSEIKKIIDLCESKAVKRLKIDTFEVEFFQKTPEPMNLDQVTLAKALSDTLPPDSAMLFASAEDMMEKGPNESEEFNP